MKSTDWKKSKQAKEQECNEANKAVTILETRLEFANNEKNSFKVEKIDFEVEFVSREKKELQWSHVLTQKSLLQNGYFYWL